MTDYQKARACYNGTMDSKYFTTVYDGDTIVEYMYAGKDHIIHLDANGRNISHLYT